MIKQLLTLVIAAFSALTLVAQDVVIYGVNSENVRLSQDGYYSEPSVAEAILEAMLREHSKIAVSRSACYGSCRMIPRCPKRIVRLRMNCTCRRTSSPTTRTSLFNS